MPLSEGVVRFAPAPGQAKLAVVVIRVGSLGVNQCGSTDTMCSTRPNAEISVMVFIQTINVAATSHPTFLLQENRPERKFRNGGRSFVSGAGNGGESTAVFFFSLEINQDKNKSDNPQQAAVAEPSIMCCRMLHLTVQRIETHTDVDSRKRREQRKFFAGGIVYSG